jgi:hypothetical protein
MKIAGDRCRAWARGVRSTLTEVLSVLFQRAADLLEQRAHLQRGAFFVPEPDPLPEPFVDVLLRVEGPAGGVVELTGRVLQIVKGRGIAIAFDDLDGAKKKFAALFAEAENVPDPLAGATWVFWGRGDSNATDATDPPEAAARDATDVPDVADMIDAGDAALSKDEAAAALRAKLETMPSHEKIQLALHGDRTARLLLLRETNKSFQTFVLQNKRITIDEVRYVAGYRQASADVLNAIAQNKDWSQNAGIASALVRNPKTPSTIAVKLLDKLPLAEVRRLAKSNDAPRAIQIAARKRASEV